MESGPWPRLEGARVSNAGLFSRDVACAHDRIAVLDSPGIAPIPEVMSVSPIQPAASSGTTWDDLRALRATPGAAAPADGAAPEARVADDAVFSAEALALSRGDTVTGEGPDETREPGEAADGEKPAGAGESLTEEERQQVDKLKARDAEVRAHEAGHMAAGGSHVRGGATYTYQQGPDGKQYAIGGEVGIDVSSISGNPQATIQKMQQVRAAALAPAEPSGADRAVAAAASQVEAQAREQLAARNAERVTSAYSDGQDAERGGLVDTTA